MADARSLPVALACAALLGCAPGPAPAATRGSPATPATPAALPTPPGLDAGPIRYQIVVSRPAQLFHIVDQLSRWSSYCHPQYQRWLPADMTATEREALAAHVALRARRPWGKGLEQSFYVDGDLAGAAARAVATRLLTGDEAREEQRILEVWAPRLEPLLASEAARVMGFRARIERELPRMREAFEPVARLAAVREPRAMILVLVPSPRHGGAGGGANGGRLVVEVAEGIALTTLYHESFHALVDAHKRAMGEAAIACGDELDGTTVSESLAYAFAPGLAPGSADGQDKLAAWIDTERREAKPASEPYVRFKRLALRMRPLLDRALREGGSVGALISSACGEHRGLRAEPWP